MGSEKKQDGGHLINHATRKEDQCTGKAEMSSYNPGICSINAEMLYLCRNFLLM